MGGPWVLITSQTSLVKTLQANERTSLKSQGRFQRNHQYCPLAPKCIKICMHMHLPCVLTSMYLQTQAHTAPPTLIPHPSQKQRDTYREYSKSILMPYFIIPCYFFFNLNHSQGELFFNPNFSH